MTILLDEEKTSWILKNKWEQSVDIVEEHVVVLEIFSNFVIYEDPHI